jgi:hypothetical protein
VAKNQFRLRLKARQFVKDFPGAVSPVFSPAPASQVMGKML